MTKEQIIRSMFDAIDANRWVELATYFEDRIIYERPGYEPIRGLGELLDFYEHRRIIAQGTHVLDHIVVADDAAAVWGHFSGTSRQGDPLAVRFADAYLFRADQISRRTTYFYQAAV